MGCILKVYPHMKNGRFYGAFYYLDNGKAMYLAHRKRREVFQVKNAWCIDLSTLNECKARGIDTIGVVTQSSVGKFFYITPLADMFDSPHSFAHFGDTRQRGLPLTKFRLNPSIDPARISSAIKVR